MKKGLRRIGIIVLLLFLAVMLFFYYGTFSSGVRAGIVMKVSKRGTVIKTYEGQMNLETFGAVESENIVSETFNFSVEKGNDELIKQLEEAARSGKRINLRYIERYVVLPWRGETKYFAIGVEMNTGSSGNEERRDSPLSH
jgi:hypothetical protein